MPDKDPEERNLEELLKNIDALSEVNDNIDTLDAAVVPGENKSAWSLFGTLLPQQPAITSASKRQVFGILSISPGKLNLDGS